MDKEHPWIRAIQEEAVRRTVVKELWPGMWWVLWDGVYLMHQVDAPPSTDSPQDPADGRSHGEEER